ncbi:MAG: polysaccharide biosynthesis C-terminal domain-containing protein [Candidatus Eremiobacteraeota bacterium]|nr:polysaccharide biosynthesis C-terminal domain-containing protein [Candidatus Eremiobacteraeota bacterium]
MQFRTGVLYDGLYTFVLQAANVVLAFAVGLLTARLLGPTGKGIYALPVVQAGLIAASFGGLTSATSYYLLNERAGRRIIAVLSLTSALFVTVGIAAVAIVAAVSHALWAAPAAIASLPGLATIAAVRGYVTGIKRIRYVGSLSTALAVASLAFTAIGLFLVARTPFVAIAAWVLSTNAVAAVAWVAMILHARSLEPGNRIEVRAFFLLAVKGGATALVSLLNYRADLYVVAIMLSTRDLGLYSVATSAPQALLFPAQVAATVTSPHIGGFDRKTAASITARCARHSMLISFVICTLVFVLAPALVGAFYGGAFLPLVPALRILLVGVVALALAGPISSYYTLKLGKPEVPLMLAGISAVICIAATIVLIPTLGIAGAATASTASYLLTQALAMWYFRRSTGIGFGTMLVPTRLDLRLYVEFLGRLRQDGARLLRRPAGTAG